jgi:hypothetical protein
MKNWIRTVFVIPFLLVSFMAQASAKLTIVVCPGFEAVNETRYLPYIALLQEALQRTASKYGPAKVQTFPLPMTESRYTRELERGTIDVVWDSATVEHERRMLPVRIPLDKGLLGYRVALIARERQPLIDKVKTLEDLRKLKVGQGIGWGDIDLYRYNGVKVIETVYESLFGMVSIGRFDLFPRGVGEVFAEYENYSPRYPHLAVEKHLLLYYPWPYYFFFNRKSGVQLARRVEEGLRMMIDDGSYNALFQKHYGAAINRANLDRRRIIRLENPSLPKETPFNDARLWFTPTRATAK